MTDSDIHAQIEADRTAALPAAAALEAFREYARGRHRSTLTAGQAHILRGLLGNLFCDNVCKRVLAELRNRLRLARFEVSGTAGDAAAVGDFLERLWTLNTLPALSAAVHWAMLRDGDHAVGLTWSREAGRVILTRERWWNGSTGLFVAYDDLDRPVYAVKEWGATGAKRRTLYYPDRMERYRQEGAGWRMYNRPDDFERQPETPRPVPWVTRGEPLGLPLVHFANIQIPNDGRGTNSADEPDARYGMSELDGGILGLQDEVNDLHRDISAAARFAGYQMLYATGITRRTDEQGNPAPTFRVEPGALFEEENPAARFGTLPPGSLAELERALQIKLQAVSRAANIPMHVISGEWPSGEALLRAEMPLIDKVETIGAAAGPAWASVAHKATRLANAFGGARLNEEALITAVFAPVARRDLLTLVDVAAKLAPFVSGPEVLRTLGYAPQDIDRILAERGAVRPLQEQGDAA
jgi:hypothetical protein